MKKSTRSPIKDKPLRQPGQSVAEQRDKILENSVMQPLMLAAFMLIFAGIEWWRDWMNAKPSPWVFSLAAVLVILYAVVRIWRVIPRLRNLRQALVGEQVVGQYLERLRQDGYQVFHDIVGDGFNLDHVLIGPAGIFTIETKTWSKPEKGRASVIFDGETLTVGGLAPSRDPVVQGRAQAGWLRSMLRESTGREFEVRPVIVFPGWYVENPTRDFSGMWVLEPKALPEFLRNERSRLVVEDAKIASFHLSRFIRTSQTDR